MERLLARATIEERFLDSARNDNWGAMTDDEKTDAPSLRSSE
jgi:hypothetical protein